MVLMGYLEQMEGQVLMVLTDHLERMEGQAPMELQAPTGHQVLMEFHVKFFSYRKKL